MVNIGKAGKISIFIAPVSEWNDVESWDAAQQGEWDATNQVGFDFTGAYQRLFLEGVLNKNEEFDLVLDGLDNTVFASDMPVWYGNIILIFVGVLAASGNTGKIIFRGYIDKIKFTSRDSLKLTGYRSLMDTNGIQAAKKAMSPNVRGYDIDLALLLDSPWLTGFEPLSDGEDGGADA